MMTFMKRRKEKHTEITADEDNGVYTVITVDDDNDVYLIK